MVICGVVELRATCMHVAGVDCAVRKQCSSWVCADCVCGCGRQYHHRGGVDVDRPVAAARKPTAQSMGGLLEGSLVATADRLTIHRVAHGRCGHHAPRHNACMHAQLLTAAVSSCDFSFSCQPLGAHTRVCLHVWHMCVRGSVRRHDGCRLTDWCC